MVKETTESVEVWKVAFVDALLCQLRKQMHDCASPFAVNCFVAFFASICLRVNYEY